MKRLLLVTILMVIGICPLLADTYCNLEFVDSWRSPYPIPGGIGVANTSLAYHEGYLYSPGCDHVYILETSDSGYIEFETAVLDPVDPWIGNILIRNNLAYVSHSSRITIYDITDPLVFDSLGSCSVTYSNKLFLFDSLLISDARYLHVIDISDSTNPVYLRNYRKPFSKVGLPAVCEDDFPYVFVPVMIYHDETHVPYYEAFINVIDVTESYTSSPYLNILDTIPSHWFEAMAKVGDYYIGADGATGSNITHYIMDSTYMGARSIRHERVSGFGRRYLQTLNDSLVYCSGTRGFQIVNVGDTSSIEIVASFENTDTSVFEYYEVFYDCVLQDSFLYVSSGHISLDSDRDTLYVLSFKLDLGFSGQCENENKPDNIEIESYPNPFNSNCNISYTFDSKNAVNIGIFDIGGKLEAEFANMQPSGSVHWDGSGNETGVYLVRASSGESVVSKKIVYIK